MAEIRTVTTLRRKRDKISASIRMYEKKRAQARADLAHVTAAIRIFAGSDRPPHFEAGEFQKVAQSHLPWRPSRGRGLKTSGNRQTHWGALSHPVVHDREAGRLRGRNGHLAVNRP